MNNLKRLLIGPLSFLAALFLIFYLYKQTPVSDLAPKNMQKLQKVQTSLDIQNPGMYHLFYVVPLDLSSNSSESDVRRSLSSSDYYQNIVQKVEQTKATITDDKTDTVLFKEHDANNIVFKGGSPEIWFAARSVYCFTVKNPGTYNIDVRRHAELNEPVCDFAIGIIPPPPKTDLLSSLSYLLCFLIIPLGYIAGFWVVMMITPWKDLAEKFAHNCDLKQMLAVNDNASLGKVPAQLLPGKIHLRETPKGLELAVGGLLRYLGFNDILIPWGAFASATRSGESVVFALNNSEAEITLPVRALKEAPQYIAAFKQNPNANQFKSQQANRSKEEAEEEELPVVSFIEALSVKDKSKINLAKRDRIILGFIVTAIGFGLCKICIFDVLEAAKQKMAVVHIYDAAILLAPLFAFLGLFILGESIIKSQAQLTRERQITDVKKQQLIGFLLVIPAALFWLWFHWELTKYGYPFL